MPSLRCDSLVRFLRNHCFATKWTNPRVPESPNRASLLSENSTLCVLPRWVRCLLRGIPTVLQWWPPTTQSQNWFLQCLLLPTSAGRSKVTIVAAAPLWELPRQLGLVQSSKPNRAPVALPRVHPDATPVDQINNANEAVCPE